VVYQGDIDYHNADFEKHMNKIVIAALSILILTWYAGGIAPAQDDTTNTSFRSLADSTEGKWGTLTTEQAALPDHLVKVAER